MFSTSSMLDQINFINGAFGSKRAEHEPSTTLYVVYDKANVFA